MIKQNIGEYKVDFGKEIKNLGFQFPFLTKYGEQYDIEGVKFDGVLKEGEDYPKYQAYLVEASLNGKEDLEIFIVFPDKLIKYQTPDFDESINDMVRDISILQAKIILNEGGKKDIEPVEITKPLREYLEQLKLKFQKVTEKRIGF